MSHWHFLRLTYDPSHSTTPGIIDMNLFFVLNQFPTSESACEILADDVVERYPGAKRFSSFADVRTIMPAQPGSAFYYRTRSGTMVMWRLVECYGRCKEVMRSTEQGIRQSFARKTGLPVQR